MKTTEPENCPSALSQDLYRCDVQSLAAAHHRLSSARLLPAGNHLRKRRQREIVPYRELFVLDPIVH
ncbi:MAG TPA: hypothetical protein P5057_09370, partial [Acidobacteriota bacterium]|nr:hypothetical protein [Acidobacteriota bacterium]